MKRTAELVLGIIGSVLILLGVIMMFAFNSVAGTGEFQDVLNEELQNDPQLSAEEADMVGDVIEGMSSVVSLLTVAFIISLVLGIVATILVKKKAKLAGVLFIVGGVAGLASIVPAILFVIAGIIALVRKVPKEQEQPIETV
ncbi:DUF4064 domain-containing protein [Alkalicoccobacillus porphyridii]|uniref:DUF4064 domain-containing protein n=1 Tax=Alkalicoccobacillus porphyridii TaxID=2597270 RepID=A0A553ZUL8_9BACI|nr:DUF4064 domain-containing protein [Alkalicoccobacillus porphyridii]TSB45006.1 DUF4064 domain-containing protein [Alkalicoccobacillus porphyridii]